MQHEIPFEIEEPDWSQIETPFWEEPSQSETTIDDQEYEY